MNKDPTRLLDDVGRAPGLRDGLRSAAETLHPPCDVDAGTRRLEAAIRRGAIPPEPPVPGPILMARLYSPSALVLGIGIIGIAALVVAPRFTAPGVAPALVHVATEPAPLPRPAMMVVAAPDVSAGMLVNEPPAAAIVTPETRDHPSAHSITPPSAPQASWRAEMLQLERARSLLRSDPAAALGAARAGQRAFPTGLYGEERDAIEIQALDALGRVSEVHAHAERFLARHPRGPFSESVRALEASTHPPPPPTGRSGRTPPLHE